jgi:hypothetical protein
MPPIEAQAQKQEGLVGKAEPFRTVRRQSRDRRLSGASEKMGLAELRKIGACKSDPLFRLLIPASLDGYRLT